MKIIVSGLGGKHELDVSPEDALRAVKQKLEPMTGLDSAQMKLLVKGKSPDDGATVGALGLADGAKVMLMRSQLGAKKEAASAPPPTAGGGGPSWLVGGAKVLYRAGDGSLEHAVVRVVHTDDPAAPYYTIDVGGAERQTPGDRLLRPDATAPTPPPAAPSEAGAGPISLTVTQGKRQLLLRAEPATTVAALKALLSGMLDGAAPAAMKLLYKGKEATNDATTEGLGLPEAGGKMMLLFRAGHHKAAEGAAVVRDAAVLLADVRERLGVTRQKITKRLLSGAEALAALGELDGEVAALRQDVRNAAPNEAAQAAAQREAQLAELEALAEQLTEARRQEAQAELRSQLGR